MSTRPSKRITPSPSEESSLCGSGSGEEDEKTIPFLRRLRDMLKENGGVISFVPGRRRDDGSAPVLGRIVVHDRIQVEAKILPRYFNHSSFASLRRQLNYFSFVRLGKGRQRESSYLNEAVVDLDDILVLKRRTAGSAIMANGEEIVMRNSMIDSTFLLIDYNRDHSFSSSANPSFTQKDRGSKKKRRRLNTPAPMMTTTTKATLNCSAPFVISEDEQEAIKHQNISLDLTKPITPDDEVLAGCSALLGLSKRAWAS